MQYAVVFLEGVVTFLSPCLLPLLPVYVSYFLGGETDRPGRTLLNALGFVTGFTLVFVLLGAFAGTLGRLLVRYGTAVNIVAGLIVVVFGLNYLGVLKIGFLNRTLRPELSVKKHGFFPSLLFGVVFSIGWTPCVGAFLGSALLLASQQGSVLAGVGMLLAYSAGLGVPFLLSALLIDRFKTAFDGIKRHYKLVNTISGAFLVLVGVLMMTGLMGRLLTLLS